MYSYETRIHASMLGPDGIITFASMVNLMQDCSIGWIESEPEFGAYMEQAHIGLMITSRQVEVVRRPAYHEHVRVETSVYKCNQMLGYRNTFICTAEGEPLVKSWSIGPFIDIATGEMAKLPAEAIARMTLDAKREMTYLSKRIKLPQAEPVAQEPYRAMRFDTDTNQHVNNVSYIRVAEEYAPSSREASGMRVEYKAQAHLGDALHPLVYTTETATVASLAKADGSPYAIVEFTR